MPLKKAALRLRLPVLGTALSFLIVGLVAVIDYRVGPETIVVPLYFVPVSIAAWYAGATGAALVSAMSATCWQIANEAAGLEYSHPRVWLANMAMHLLACALVGALIAYLRQRVEREEWSSRHDALTGLPNSRAFYERAEQELARARRYGGPLTAAYIDLDNFKELNDRCGHKAGDAALRSVARLLQLSARASDIAARIGGDEFVVLMPETDAEGARAVLERFRTALEAAVSAGKLATSASIGAVSFLTAPSDVEQLLGAADESMYAAKRSGKNLIRVDVAFRPSG